MRHAIYPGAERAIYAEAFEVPPEREMNLLQEVAPLVRIRLVATRQTVQSRGILCRGPFTQVILRPHMRGSLNSGNFLTAGIEKIDNWARSNLWQRHLGRFKCSWQKQSGEQVLDSGRQDECGGERWGPPLEFPGGRWKL